MKFNKLFLLIAMFFVSVLLVSTVFAAPPDSDNNGCVSLGEISVYVGQWLNGYNVTLSQVSSGISWWLNGCNPQTSGSIYSAAYPLTWSSTPVNTGTVGAESNPTGNPIGGFYGYNRIVSPSDADYIVYNREQFINLFKYDDYHNQILQPGDVVYVDDNAVIDLTGVWNFNIPGNVTLASGRGRGFSKGALIKNLQQVYGTDRPNNYLMHTDGAGVRITGLRFEGPDKSTQSVRHSQIFYQDPPRADNISGSYYDMSTSIGINSRYSLAEIDNCEFYGWTIAISVGRSGPDFGGTEPLHGWDSSNNMYIHHNYIHHNPHAGLGYGITVNGGNETYPIAVLIQGNLFDFNRHAIASSSANWGSYEASYNLVLPESFSIPFDRHGGGGLSGLHTIIHHNTDRFMKENRGSIGITNPGYPPGISMAYNNWVYKIRLLEAIGNNNYPEIEIFGNLAHPFPAPGVNLPVALMTINKDSVKIGESISFSASQSTGGTYGLSYVCWNFGDRTDEVCGFANDLKTHSYSQPGRYLVTLKVVDVKGIFSETTKSIIVMPSDPTKVILSFWIRDSYNEYNTNDASGYFSKQVLIDNDVVWQRDVNADGWEWEHVVIDISNYVDDESVVDFQIQSLQNYQRQNYPAYHPFEFFELYIDDIYISNRDYPVENFGDWEADELGNDLTKTLEGQFSGHGISHFYNNGGENWWKGTASYDDKNSGKYGYRITSGYRENSIAGTTRGIKHTIKAPNVQPYLDVVNNFGAFRDVSSYQLPVNFAGAKDSSNNDILDFYGYSKKFNGIDNYVTVGNFDLSRDYILDLNLFVPYQNSQQTLMYATSGANYVHIYYSPTNNIVLKTNGVETTCSLPQLSHSSFNKIVVGRSCNGATCTLSCASNGVVNSFTNPNTVMTLSGTSTINFGGYNGGTTNLFGAIQRIRIVKGSIASTVFVDESKSKLQGAWYFRDGTNGVIQDGSLYNKDIDLPSGINFGVDNQRKFIDFNRNGPTITIPRDSTMIIGNEFSIEFVGRFNELNGFNVVNGVPYTIFINPGSVEGWPADQRAMLYLKIIQQEYPGDSQQPGWNAVRHLNRLKENTWYHVAFIKEGEYLNTYINGVVDRKVYVPGVLYDNSVVNNLLMGYFNGDISRLSIYDKTLTPSEIDALYKSSSLGCSDGDDDGYGVFPRSGVVNGCRLNGYDCNDANAGVGSGGC